MKLAELLDEAKLELKKEKEEAAKELLKCRILEIEATEKLLRTQKRQMEELLNKSVDDAEEF